jgi:hypothetical protein
VISRQRGGQGAQKHSRTNSGYAPTESRLTSARGKQLTAPDGRVIVIAAIGEARGRKTKPGPRTFPFVTAAVAYASRIPLQFLRLRRRRY